MKRRSPIKHHVKDHERAGVQVHDYDRGKGSRPPAKTASKIRAAGRDFNVTFYYGRGSEAHSVGGPTFTQALIQGTGLMSRGEYPSKVVVRSTK